MREVGSDFYLSKLFPELSKAERTRRVGLARLTLILHLNT